MRLTYLFLQMTSPGGGDGAAASPLPFFLAIAPRNLPGQWIVTSAVCEDAK